MSLAGTIRRTEALMHAFLLDHGYREQRVNSREYLNVGKATVVVIERVGNPALPIVARVYRQRPDRPLLASAAKLPELRELVERGIA